MTMRRSGLVAAAAIAVIIMAVPLAHAGGGMGAGSGTTSCRVIQGGPNPPQVVRLTDPYATGTEVQVGPAALICDLPTTGLTIAGDPTQAPSNPNGIVCYPVLGSDKEKFPATITDVFTLASSPDPVNVTIAGLRLLCVDAVIVP